MTQKNDRHSKISWVMGHLDFGSPGGGGLRKKKLAKVSQNKLSRNELAKIAFFHVFRSNEI